MHYVKRFISSLTARRINDQEFAWVKDHVNDAELELWQEHSREDKRHTYDVARRVEADSDADDKQWRINAALMHDVGKLTSDLSTFGRVFATITMLIFHRGRVIKWQDLSGMRGQIGRYCAHPEIGAVLLQSTDSDQRVVVWAGEHHRSKGFTIALEDAIVLKAADHG